MKVLQVFDILSSRTNGTVAIVSQVSQVLAQRGHEVTIFTTDYQSDPAYRDSLKGVKTHPFHCWLILPGMYLAPGVITGAKAEVKDFDIIHLHCLRSFQNIAIHHYARKYGIPYIVDAHGSTPRIAEGGRGTKWLLKWLFDVAFGYKILRDASWVIAESEVGASEYKKFGVNQDKIVLIHPPLDIEAFSNLPPRGHFRSKYGIKEKHVILFLGRINWIKGLGFLVESFYELTKSRSDVILAIVGNDDGYKSTLDRLVGELGLSDKVLFTGFLGGGEKLSALVDADVLVQTSLYEQSARPPLEAVLCGTPVVVTKHTGAGEDVRKIDAGYLIEYGNETELSDTIQYVLENQAEAQRKTQKAGEYIKANLSLEKVVEKYEKLYEGCIAAKPKGI